VQRIRAGLQLEGEELYLTVIVNIDHTTASYAGAARKILGAPAGHGRQHG